MKSVLKKRTPISILTTIFGVTTILFVFFGSSLNIDNKLFRIITAASVLLFTLFMGIHTFSKQKYKVLGYLYIGVSGFALVSIIYNIFAT